MLYDNAILFYFFYGRTRKNGIRDMVFLSEKAEVVDRLKKIRNFRVGSILVFQFGVVTNILRRKWDAVILLGDMYVISNWIAAIIARARRQKVFFWGHGIYGDEASIKLFFRKLFLSLADGHFVYGQYARELMVKHGFDQASLHVVYNSLDYDQHKKIRLDVLDAEFYARQKYFSVSGAPVLVFIGRLTPEKRIDLLLNAIETLKLNGTIVNLIVIGEGDQKLHLEHLAKPIANQVHFYGACYDEYEIGRVLANADLCVSPGNVGLTAIHSLSFGTPVCTHDDMTKQGPEAEAIIPGKTGIFYNRKEGNLCEAISAWLSVAREREKVRQSCYEIIDSRYNPDVQLSIFKRVLLHV